MHDVHSRCKYPLPVLTHSPFQKHSVAAPHTMAMLPRVLQTTHSLVWSSNHSGRRSLPLHGVTVLQLVEPIRLFFQFLMFFPRIQEGEYPLSLCISLGGFLFQLDVVTTRRGIRCTPEQVQSPSPVPIIKASHVVGCYYLTVVCSRSTYIFSF